MSICAGTQMAGWVQSKHSKLPGANHSPAIDDLNDIIPVMPLTLKEVEHIANLARLDLTDDEKARYREQLSAILDYFTQLSELDTGGIPPTSSVLSPRSVLRDDEPHPGLSLEDLLRNAPDAEAGQFRVPFILE